MSSNLSNSAKGAWCMITGSLLLTTQDAITKWLTTDFHAGEIMFYRGIFTFVPIIIFVTWARNWRALASSNLKGTLIRAGLGTTTSALVVLSFVFLPLTDALAIIFLGPIMLTALSLPLLGERVGSRRWFAVFVAFFGVLLIVQPGDGGFQFFVIIPLVTALFSALRDIATRHLRTNDSSLSILFYSMLVALIASAASIPILGGHWPNFGQWVLFAIAGTLNSLSHFLTIQALLWAPGGTVAPFKYLSLVWATAISYGVWGDIPAPWTIAGAALIVGAGIFILHREIGRC